MLKMNYALFNGKSEVLRNQTSAFLRVFLLIFCLTGGSNYSYGQAVASCPPVIVEICNDDIDNDGDGLTDCADPQCYSSILCDETLTCPIDVLYLTKEFPVGDGTILSDVWEDAAIATNIVTNQFAGTDPDGFTLADGTPLPGHTNAPDRGDDIEDIATLGFIDSDVDGDPIDGGADGDEPAVLNNDNGKEAAKQTTFIIVPPDATCIDFRVNPAREDNGRLYLGINSTSMEEIVGGTGTGGLTGSYAIPAGVQGVTSSCGVFWPVIQARFYHVDPSAFSNTIVQWDLNDGEGFQDVDPSYFTSDITAVEFVESQRMVYRDADNVRLFEAGGQERDEANPLFCEPGTEEVCLTDAGPFCECELQDANSTVFAWNAFGTDATLGTMPFTNTCGNEESNYTLGITGNAVVRTNANNLLIGNQGMAVGECTQVSLDLETPVAPKFYIRDIDVRENISITGTLNGVLVKPIILTRNRRSIVGVGVAPDASIAGQITADATNLSALSRRNYGSASTINSVEVYFSSPIDQLVFDVCKTSGRSYNIFVANFETCCENTVALCNDAVDNDGDGIADCDDPKCQGLAEGCFIPCPAEDRAPIRTWNQLSGADRMTLANGGTVTVHPTGFCDPADDDEPVLVDITSSAAPDAPNSTDINALQPKLSGNNSFRLGRQTSGTSGVQYCFDFSQGTNFLIDSREHAIFAGSEVVVFTAAFQGSAVDLAGEWGNPGQAGPATITGNGTDKVTFASNGKTGSGLWWRLASTGDEPIDQLCVQYFRTDATAKNGVEPFRFLMCGEACPDFVEPVITCNDPQPITRWNALTGAERGALDDNDPTTNVVEFNTGFCNPEDGSPFFMDIETSGAQNSAQPNNTNNKPPRRAFNASFFDGRSNGGASGNENCFVFEEAVPFRVDSREHRVFNGAERITITAFVGADPVVLTGQYNGVAGPAIITGNGTTELTFNANGKVGPGLWWEASAGDEPVTKVCVQYYRTGGAFTGVEPYRVMICNTDRCVFDDPYAIAERDLGDGELAGELPAGTLADQLDVVKSIAGIEQAASGVPGNVDLTFRITTTNNGTETLSNLQLIDNIENAISPAALVGFISGTVDAASTATANPTVSGTYDGAADDEVLVGTDGTLAVGETLIIDLVFEVDASALLPNEQFTNQVLVTGENPDGTLATAASDADGEVGETGGNIDPTLVYVPVVNLTKALVENFPVQSCQGVGNVNARFELTLENTGNVDVTNVQIVDDLIGQLGAAFVDISFIQYAEITASTATTDPTLNIGFNDDVFETNIFDGLSGLLEPGQSITVQFIVVIDPDAPGAEVLTNQAEVTANGVNPADDSILLDPNTGVAYVATDLSDDGTDPNSTNAGSPGDLGTQNDPTPINGGNVVGLTSIGLVKTTTNVVQSATPGNINVTYQLRLANLGSSTVTDIQITDNAAQQLGDAYVGFVSGPSVSGGGATVNSAFNAGFEPDVFNGTTGSLNPGQTVTVTFTVEVNPSAVADPMTLTNQALATVNTGGDLLTDLSDSGDNPATSNTGAMGDTGCSDDPTPVFGNFPLIIQAPMDMCVESYGVGDTPLDNWIANNGNLEIITPESCMPAVITNDYSPENFVETCSAFAGSVDVNFFYSDACGNSYEFSATFALKDETPPSCVKPVDLTIACDDPDFDATVASYTAYWGSVTDLSHPITIESSYSEDGFDDNGQQIITWTFTDACGNSRSWDALLTVTGDCSVEECIASAGTLTINAATVELSNGAATVSATSNGDALVPEGYSTIYVLTSGADLVIEQVNADAPTFNVTTEGNYTIHTLVYDATTLDLSIVVPGTTTGFDVFGLTQAGGGDICASLDAAGALVTVNPEPVTPVLTVTPPTNFNLDCTEAVPGVGVVATTTCPDGVVNVTDSEVVTPMGCPGSFTIVRTYEVSDNCGNSETATQTIVVADTTAPVFTSVPAGADVDCTAYPDGFGTPVASDACGGVTVTFEDNLAPYICDADFNITRTWTATDECGNVATASQTLTVWPDVEAPLFSFVPGNTTVTCGQAVEFGTPTISDACTGFTLTENVTATGTCPEAYTTTKTWTAVDGCGNASVQSQTITVLAAPAPIALGFTFVPENKFVECGDAVEFGEPTCEGNCDTGFSINVEDITTTSEVCENTQILTRRWTATDACDNVAIAEQTITIVDTTAPVFTDVPADKLVACGAVIFFNEPVALDLCGGVTLTFTEETEWANCEGVAYSVTRNWTAADACGNTTTFANTISVEEDATAPVLTALEDKVVTCSEGITFDTPIATDNCDDVSLSYSDVVTENGCEIVHTRTWTASDGCNNVSETVQKITVTDDLAPTFSIESNSISMTAYAYQNWTVPEVIALDECSNVEAEGPFVFDHENGRIDHSWTTIDACGNRASVTLIVNIITINFPGGGGGSGSTLTVFPNPTGGELTLSFGTKTEGTATVVITDVLGRTYLTQKAGTYVGQNVVRLNLSDLPQGTYLVKINDGVQELTDTFIKF